jgi:type 2 lantibiotic biosynthesis protein LanM
LSVSIDSESFHDLFKALYLDERRTFTRSMLFDYLRGREKFIGWQKLEGFEGAPDRFHERIAIEGLSNFEFCSLLGQRSLFPSKSAYVDRFFTELASDSQTNFPLRLPERHSVLADYCQRGLMAPFHGLLDRSLTKLVNSKVASEETTVACWVSQLGIFEQIVRRAVVLDINIKSLKGELEGEDESEQFRDYVKSFEGWSQRRAFFIAYPVLYRTLFTKLELWSESLKEFLGRLMLDRALLESELGVPQQSLLLSVQSAGDTHNLGRCVLVLEFSDGMRIVYKPRSTSLEAGFQQYLSVFNSLDEDICLKLIRVIDRGEYGWVEYVNFENQLNELESRNYYTKLGFLTAIVHSISGVDVFFENLISCGPDPVIVDLETMFHTPIEQLNESPVNQSLAIIHRSVAGIGILPQPNVGASDTEVFDISVMGARTDAKAPYKVTGIENFGRSDVRITSIPGWIPENTASSEDRFDSNIAAESFFFGISRGFACILQHRDAIAKDGGVIDQIFGDCDRRLIVRDTKVYGTLQQDENHPDLLRDQIDRQWFWDRLWAELPKRPILHRFIRSELNQLKQGDIPYFNGKVGSTLVTGGDGTRIDLSGVIKGSPLELVKTRMLQLTSDELDEQKRIAATTLGLDQLHEVTQPKLDFKLDPKENAISIAQFIRKRLKQTDDFCWLDTSFCPVPKAIGVDPVRVAPCDPFMYEGVMGVSMYLHDISLATGEEVYMTDALRLVQSIIVELKTNKYRLVSGFVGTSSVIYGVNRCIQRADAFHVFEADLFDLVEEVAIGVREETRLDFLVGISGVASALLPFARRTSHPKARKMLAEIADRLWDAGTDCLSNDSPIEGMDCVRGLSHGITGLALSLYRLSDFLNQEKYKEMALKLILHEYEVVKKHGWTDDHSYNGSALVGWCHGSAGIAMGLASMHELRQKSEEVSEYFDMSVAHTFEHGQYDSSCLCHGSVGNLFCLEASSPSDDRLHAFASLCTFNLMRSGFSSFGPSQTMGIGLMTGLAGAGHYLLSRSDDKFDSDFLTLA